MQSARAPSHLDAVSFLLPAARAVIREVLPQTPLLRSVALSEAMGANIYLKCEHIAPTGSFKIRGAYFRLSRLPKDERARGVIAASTGNHGLAVAHAGSLLGVPVSVFMPRAASPAKVQAIGSYGCEILQVDGNSLDAELAARKEAQRRGCVFVSPYNDIDVIAGQGTVGIEILEQLPEVDAITVAVGGGGLFCGVSAALRGQHSKARVIACWPEAASSLFHCATAKTFVRIDESDTISDATAGPPEPDSVTIPLASELLDQAVLVSEHEIQSAMRRLAVYDRLIVEGAAGVALAGAVRCAAEHAGKNVVVVLCGRNIGFERFETAVKAATQQDDDNDPHA